LSRDVLRIDGEPIRFSISASLLASLVKRSTKCWFANNCLRVQTGNLTYCTVLQVA